MTSAEERRLLARYARAERKMRRLSAPKKTKIARAWAGRLPGDLAELKASQLRIMCWACWAESQAVQRCHIVAHSHGGSNDPANYFLLCWRCHRDQPDGAPIGAQLRWLATAPHWMSRVATQARKTIDACAGSLGLTDDQLAEGILSRGTLKPGSAGIYTENLVSTAIWAASEGVHGITEDSPSTSPVAGDTATIGRDSAAPGSGGGSAPPMRDRARHVQQSLFPTTNAPQQGEL